MILKDVDTAIDWEPYEAKIPSRFVGQNYTLEDTRAHIRNTYGLNARYITPSLEQTLRFLNRTGILQLSSVQEAFSGFKNLKAHEWITVVEEVRNRAMWRINSEVCLYGRPINRERVKREVKRYGKMPQTEISRRGNA